MMRAALLRPMSLLMLAIGAVSFAFTLAWWIVPLTAVTYASLVFLATRDPIFRSTVLEGRQSRPGLRPGSSTEKRLSPERRARWLPRGETRRTVEEALELRRRTVFAIEESGDVARAVLGDAVSKLDRVVERLVDVAEKREKAAGAIRDLGPSGNLKRHQTRNTDLAELEKELRAADAEIYETLEKLKTLRTRIVRVSIESGNAAQEAAANLNTDLDELNLRLDALRSTMSPSEPPDR